MKVLTVCRNIPRNIKLHNYPIAEFIYEQNEALTALGVKIDYYLIKRGGYKNYLKEIYEFQLYLKEKKYNYDIIHAHGGHIGSVVNTQRKIPVVTTYHGSDLNNSLSRLISLGALLFSRKNIFVSSELLKKVHNYAIGDIIPCGVDLEIFKPLSKTKCRLELGLNEIDKIVLFAGDHQKKVKNFQLAKKAIDLNGNKQLLIELKEFDRRKVNLLLNAADLLLLTSLSEGSPQVIKEAMCCKCPIVATDVGDIKEMIGNTEGCHITSFDPYEISEKINLVISSDKRTNGREKVKHLDNKLIAGKIINIYYESTNTAR